MISATPRASALPQSLASRLGPVCVAISVDDLETCIASANAALCESRFLELRLDALKNPEGVARALEPLRQFCADHAEAAVLTTCRRVAGGGGFVGSVAEQLALLLACARAGALLVDVELETLEALAATPQGQPVLARFGAELRDTGACLLVSAHDFAGASDPEHTLALLRRLSAAAMPSIYKVVTTAHCLADNLGMLDWLERASTQVPVVGICMGAAGVPSRVLALSRGAVFTFASASGGAATAAGQMDAATLLGRYRAAKLTRATKVYGVAGNPVSHSLSPVLHNAAFAAAGIDAVYLPLHTTGVDDLLAFVRGLPIEGLSVTMPWKVEVLGRPNTLDRLDALDPIAEKIGAVNTVTRSADKRLCGTNTDAAAVVEPLAREIALQGARVLLLGAGGAARAAAFALVQAGAAVSILNRTPDAAVRLAKECGAQVAVPGELHGFDVVVQATPAGMAGMLNDLPLPEAALDGVKVVFEMVYRPAETPLTRASHARGITVVHGFTMFLEQGARQWSLWTGLEAPLEAMRQALKQELEQEGTQETTQERSGI